MLSLQLPTLKHSLARLLPLALLLLLLSSPSRAQQPTDLVFADAPRETLDPAGEPAFALFNPAFYRNQVFLLGETHGVQELDFALLRHLNQRAGVRHYLVELDCAQAHYLNEYLRTGNEATLRRVFAGGSVPRPCGAMRNLPRKPGVSGSSTSGCRRAGASDSWASTGCRTQL